MAAAALAAAAACQAVQLPHVFGDGMVLQRGQTIPVWGKGRPGEYVEVSFAGQTASALVGEDGKWRVDLQPLEANAEGATFAVRGDNAIEFSDVLVGEVWFCSGQSNMEFPVAGWRNMKDSDKEVAAAVHPKLRHFRVKHKVSEVPLDDVDAKWEPTTPETIKLQSAVAYTFGETLMKELDVPVGLINCSWGGTRIEPWTPAGHPDDLWMLQNLRTWNRPHDVPTVLWNGMVAGLVPYAIKGAIWYQGCANMADGDVYLDKTVSLVRGWRREWGQGDFPYFLVQLAPYKYGGGPADTKLPVLQMAQARVPEAVPNSGCTVINDVGDVYDIHPTDKRTVGMRMADQVLDRVYGKFVRPWKTPVAVSISEEDGGRAMRVAFDDADGLRTRDGLAPTDFEIRDAVNGWIPAEARIEGRTVVVRADGADAPIGVRFAAHNGSTPNLVNGAGLPAGPFKIGRKCPVGFAETVPEAAGLECVQRYDIPVDCDMRKAVPAPVAAADGAGAVSRVGYLLELEGADGDTQFAYAEMDAFSADVRDLVLRGPDRMPDVRAKVSGLKIRTNSGAADAKDGASGFVEFYGSNYSPKKSDEPAGGDNGKYDWNDTPSPASTEGPGYGCLQVHDLDAKRTVLAFNHFNASGTPCDVGIGNAPSGEPDWTFAKNAGLYKTRRLSVWIKR